MKALIAVLLLGLAPAAGATSSQVSATESGRVSAQAALNFQITIPASLHFQLGAVNGPTALAFAPNASELASGVPVAGTPASGDLGGGQVSARVFGNAGSLLLSAMTTGPLLSETGASISYEQIAVRSQAVADGTSLPAPVLADGAVNTQRLEASEAGQVDRQAIWTFTYKNQHAFAPGVYGGPPERNGRVVYTLTTP